MRIAGGAVQEFLALRRLAVVGASADPKSFGNTIYREFRERDYEVVAVNPHAAAVEGDACYANLASVPDVVDGVVIMVSREKAPEIVRECVDRGIGHVWLFKGIGSPGAVSEEALDLCWKHGIHVVAGACPLMFFEPVAWFHRAHRAVRRMNGSLERVS